MNADFWACASNIAQVVGTVFVVIALPFAYFQLKEAAKARRLEALSRIFEEFRNESFLENRQFIYNHPAQFDFDAVDDKTKKRIRATINTFNRISFLVGQGLIPRKVIMLMWSGAILACWNKLEKYILANRKAEKFSDWAKHFENLAKDCRQYRIETLGETGTGYGSDNADDH